MNHEFYTDRLSAYFDKELKNEEFVIVDEHVKSCVKCRKLLAEFEKLNQAIESHSQLNDNDYWESSAQKIESALGEPVETEIIEISKSSYKGLWWKLTGAVASVAFLVFISTFERDITQDVHEEIQSPTITTEEIQKKTGTKENKLSSLEEDVVDGAAADDEYRGNLSETISLGEAGSSLEYNQEIPAEVPETVPILRQEQPVEQKSSKPQPVKSRDNTLGKAAAVDELQEVIAEREKSVVIDEDAEMYKSSLPQKDELAEINPSVLSAESMIPSAEEIQLNMTQSKIVSDTDKSVELEFWQRQVDNNNKLLKSKKSMSAAYVKTEKSDLKRSKSTPQIVDNESTYKRLFEAYYNIAIMTKDIEEHDNAIEFLKKHAKDINSPYFKDASQYLYKYDSVMTARNREKTEE